MTTQNWITLVIALISISFSVGIFAQQVRSRRSNGKGDSKAALDQFPTRRECDLKHDLEKERWEHVVKTLDDIKLALDNTNTRSK